MTVDVSQFTRLQYKDGKSIANKLDETLVHLSQKKITNSLFFKRREEHKIIQVNKRNKETNGIIF